MNLTAERLHEVLHYEPGTGVFTWKKRLSDKCPIGSVAGRAHRTAKYASIGIDYRRYYTHRLAWLYMMDYWPVHQIDHIDGDPFNNRWNNLREATQTLNNANSKRRKDNRSGFKRVFWSKQHRKWTARIQKRRKVMHLGLFETPEEAHAAYKLAAERLYETFARG